MRGWCSLTLAVVAALLGFSVSACATADNKRAQEPGRVSAEARTAMATTAKESAPRLDGNDIRQRRKNAYRLQAGDEMDVAFYKTPELNTHVKVRPDGNITLPFLGDVRAVDVEPGELAATLEERYADELRSPRITINVTQFGGQRVYVGGEVKEPGVVLMVGPVTALQAIQQAGGFQDTASLSSIVMIRRNGTQVQGSEIDLSDVVSGESPELDPLLQPYDIVFVPRSAIANVDLFVDQYIRLLLPMNPSLGIGFAPF